MITALRRTNKILLDPDSFKIDDWIEIPLLGYSCPMYATAVEETKDGMRFLFNQPVCKMAINKDYTNAGGYEESDLNRWMQTIFLNKFPKDMINRITDLRIPSYKQIFGPDYYYEKHLQPDNDDQFDCMHSRVAKLIENENLIVPYWLSNPSQEWESKTAFAYVNCDGRADINSCALMLYIRPEFILKNK